MGKNHLKRMNAPKIWGLPRKGTKWVTRPVAGPHKLERAVPLNIILKDFLKLAKTTKEVKHILSKNLIKIDNKIRKDLKFPIGLFDTIAIDSIKGYYRVLINEKGKFFLKKITKEESLIKPRKAIKKTIIKGKKTQITFYDGYNILNPKENIKPSYTAVFDLSNNKIKEVIPFEKGNFVFILNGKQIGKVGSLINMEEGKGFAAKKIEFKKDKETFKTIKEYALIIGRGKSVISI